METFWTVGVVAALGANAVLLLVVLGLARELGILLSRAGPTQALPTTESLPLGSSIADTLGARPATSPLTAVVQSDTRSTLVVFLSEGCSACTRLAPAVRTFARSYRHTAKVVAVLREESTALRFELEPDVDAILTDEALFSALDVKGTPFALYLAPDAAVLAKGAPNTLEQIESLFGVRSMGPGAGLTAATAHGSHPEAAQP